MYEAVVIDDFDEAERISASIRNLYTGIIGFDTETYHENLRDDPVDVIQICVPSDEGKLPKVYIFHVAQWPRVEAGKRTGFKKLPESLCKIISSKRIVKVVSAPENDAQWLWRAFEVRLLGVIDIQSVAMLKGESSFGLDTLASKYLTEWKNKNVNMRFAQWQRTLTPEMIRYAADDAYASYALMRAFEPAFGVKGSFEVPEGLPLFVSRAEENLKASGLLQQEKKSLHKIVSKILESLPEITNDVHKRETARAILKALEQRGVVMCA